MAEPTYHVADARNCALVLDPDDPIDLVLTAPPYWSPEYMDRPDWLDMMFDTVDQCQRRLAENGTIVLILNEAGHRGVVRDLLWSIDQAGDLEMIGELIWEHGGNLGQDRFDYVYVFDRHGVACEPREVLRHKAPPYMRIRLEAGPHIQRSVIFGTLPAGLTTELITRYSDVGALVLDPFCGSGSVPATACALNRRAIGIDNLREVVEYARNPN